MRPPSLLLPGDIFDAWIGDDAIRAAPLLAWRAVLAALKATAAKVPCTWAAATATS